MAIIAVPGGSRNEILELVQQTTSMQFKVFDTEPNIAEAGVWEYVGCQNEADMVRQAVHCVASGEADLLLKGGIQTHTLLKEVLKAEHGLRSETILSHVALIHIPALGRPILLSDSAMNITPNEEQLVMITNHAIEAGRKIGIIKPKVAILSAAENYNEKMPSSVLAKNITEKFRTHTTATVYGPLSLDLALSKEAVAHKRFEGSIKGDADILIVPSIDVGNVLYKSLLLFSGATMGGIICGAKVPIVLTSRSDNVQSKQQALDFALQQIEWNEDDE